MSRQAKSLSGIVPNILTVLGLPERFSFETETGSAVLIPKSRRPETDRHGSSLYFAEGRVKLAELGVAFVSLTEALDLTTPTGRAMVKVSELRTGDVRVPSSESAMYGTTSYLGRLCSFLGFVICRHFAFVLFQSLSSDTFL